MYLSRVQINPNRREGRQILGSPQALHAAVLSAFPHSDAERGRVLWRVDRNQHQNWLYVVSKHEPDFTHIVEQAGWPVTNFGWDCRPYEGLLNHLEKGQLWAFRLTANPARASRANQIVDHIPVMVPDASGQMPARSKRRGHVTVAQQLDWMLQRAEGWGFVIPLSSEAPEVIVKDRRVEHFKRKDATVTISKATFEGLLVVVEPNLLRQALVQGMGPAKGYGCGLMTLAPATTSASNQ